MRSVKAFLVVAAAVVVLAPAQARAEGYFSPWVAANTNSGFDSGRAAFGFNAGGMGAGIIGAEIGLGYSPSFFGTTDKFGNNTVIDLMGNVIVGIPVGGTHGGGIRPFVTAGVGLIRTQIDGGTFATVSSSNNDMGWNAGAGVMGYFNDHVGLRGDIRYLRNIENNSSSTTLDFDPGSFHFWRASVGVVLR